MKKKKQVILKINLDDKDIITNWETTLKGFDKGVYPSNKGYIQIFTRLLNDCLNEIRYEKELEDMKKHQEDMEKHPEDYVDIIIPDELFTSREVDLDEITKFKCRFCNNFLYTIKNEDTYFPLFQHIQSLTY